MPTYHIRRPLRRAGGSSYYRDKGDRGRGTYCGAAPTDHDRAARDTAEPWGEWVPCPDCIAARAAIAKAQE